MAISFLSWHGGPVVVLGVGAQGDIDELAQRGAPEFASEAQNVWKCVLRAGAPVSNREFHRCASSASVEDWGPTLDLTGVTSLVGPIENHPFSSVLLLHLFPVTSKSPCIQGDSQKGSF